MPPLINRQWERFCVEYFGGKTKKESAIEAGYSPKTAQQIASRLLRKVNILERLQELQQAAASAKIVSVRERKERLTEIIRTRMTDFVKVGADGVRINIGPDNANCAGLREVRSWAERNDNGTRKVVTIIKLHDHVKAIAELNKMEGT